MSKLERQTEEPLAKLVTGSIGKPPRRGAMFIVNVHDRSRFLWRRAKCSAFRSPPEREPKGASRFYKQVAPTVLLPASCVRSFCLLCRILQVALKFVGHLGDHCP